MKTLIKQMRTKGKLRNITVDGVKYKYIIEHDMDRKAELRIYNPDTKQLVNRAGFKELGFSDYEIEHSGCNITPKMVSQYIKNLYN